MDTEPNSIEWLNGMQAQIPIGKTSIQRSRCMLLHNVNQRQLDVAQQWIHDHPCTTFVDLVEGMPLPWDVIVKTIIRGHYMDVIMCTKEELEGYFPEREFWWYRNLVEKDDIFYSK